MGNAKDFDLYTECSGKPLDGDEHSSGVVGV